MHSTVLPAGAAPQDLAAALAKTRWALALVACAAVASHLPRFLPHQPEPVRAALTVAPASINGVPVNGPVDAALADNFAEVPMPNELRMSAAMGNVEASRDLTAMLLEYSRRTGNPEALHEAVQWIDRDWDTPEFLASNLVNTFVQGHCHKPVVRWHVLCNTSE
jgi:hypothetical protein